MIEPPEESPMDDPDPTSPESSNDFTEALLGALDAAEQAGLLDPDNPDRAQAVTADAFAWAAGEAVARLRQADRVPIDRRPTDWDAVHRAALRRDLRFRATELTDDGIVIIDEPVALARPIGGDAPPPCS